MAWFLVDIGVCFGLAKGSKTGLFLVLLTVVFLRVSRLQSIGILFLLPGFFPFSGIVSWLILYFLDGFGLVIV